MKRYLAVLFLLIPLVSLSQGKTGVQARDCRKVDNTQVVCDGVYVDRDRSKTHLYLYHFPSYKGIGLQYENKGPSGYYHKDKPRQFDYEIEVRANKGWK